MGWYQSQNQEAQWKSLLNIDSFSLSKMFSSDIFAQQLKSSNTEILAFLQNNHQSIFNEILSKCLVVPQQSDTHERKYKQPTQCINFLQMILDSPNNSPQTQGLPTSSLTESMIPSQLVCLGRITSVQVIKFIIQISFKQFQSNKPSSLQNTLIPGYFQKIIDILNKNYCQILIDFLKAGTTIKILMQNYSQFPQIINLIQNIVVVSITSNNSKLNINASMSMSMSVAPMNLQPNFPYDIKYQIMMIIFRKINTFNKYKPFAEILAVQHYLGLLTQILKSAHNIFEGSSLSQTITSESNIKVLFKIIEFQGRQSQQFQIRALQLLKHSFSYMTSLVRNKFAGELKQMLQYLLSSTKPSIKETVIIQIVTEWIGVEYGILNNPLKMQGNMSSSSSLVDGFSSMQNSFLADEIPHYPIYKALLKKCKQYSSCNIYHQRVSNLISISLRTKNEKIINFIFKENNIIEETVLSLADFKKNGYFGYFMMIIETYTTQRIDTPVVNSSIESTATIWNDFYSKTLKPHLEKMTGKCGQMNHPDPTTQPVFTVNKCLKEKPIESPAIIQIAKNQQKAIPESLQIDDESSEPIKVELPKFNPQNDSQVKEMQSQQQTFQSFLKKKMKESEEQLKQKKKSLSKTPGKSGTKLRSVSSKKKKWSVDPEKDEPENLKQNRQETQASNSKENNKLIEEQIYLTRIQAPKSHRTRNISAITDKKLVYWLQNLRVKTKNHQQKIR